MANINSDLATKQAASVRDRSAGIIDGDDACGIVLYATAKVNIPAGVAVNDTLTLVPTEAIPLGAVVIPQLSHVFFVTDPGTALTLDIGLTSSAKKFADGLVCNNIGIVNFAASATVPTGIATPHRFTTQEAIRATVTTSTSVVATTAIFTIAYRAKA